MLKLNMAQKVLSAILLILKIIKLILFAILMIVAFLSSLIEYEDQKPVNRYYYNAKGQWQLRENLQGGQPIVKVNPAVSYRFEKFNL